MVEKGERMTGDGHGCVVVDPDRSGSNELVVDGDRAIVGRRANGRRRKHPGDDCREKQERYRPQDGAARPHRSPSRPEAMTLTGGSSEGQGVLGAG